MLIAPEVRERDKILEEDEKVEKEYKKLQGEFRKILSQYMKATCKRRAIYILLMEGSLDLEDFRKKMELENKCFNATAFYEAIEELKKIKGVKEN